MPLPERVPVQVRLPVPPSKVHPVSAEPPERRIEEAPLPVGPILSAVVAPARRLKVVAVVVMSPPLTAKSPAAVKSAPFAVSAVEPLELITTLPVVDPPIVRGIILVVARFPSPVK